MSAPCPRFLLIDDHALFRTGLSLMLSQAWVGSNVLQAASMGEGLMALRAGIPDLIVLDVHLPDGHGVNDMPAIRAVAPRCPVLLMSADVDNAIIQRAREVGAQGFLPKSASASEVVSAVRAALAGEHAFAAVPYAVLLEERTVPMIRPVRAAPREGLVVSEGPPAVSPLQLDILRYLGRGTPNKAIARQLGMSEAAVRAEVSWLTELFNASSREEAHAQAVARGLLQA